MPCQDTVDLEVQRSFAILLQAMIGHGRYESRDGVVQGLHLGQEAVKFSQGQSSHVRSQFDQGLLVG